MERPRKCFNGANSYRFQWYDDKTKRMNDGEDTSSTVALAPLVDCGDTPINVLLNIQDKYSVLYNLQDSFNDGTKEKINQVVVTLLRKSGSDSVAGLNVGEWYTMPDPIIQPLKYTAAVTTIGLCIVAFIRLDKSRSASVEMLRLIFPVPVISLHHKEWKRIGDGVNLHEDAHVHNCRVAESWMHLLVIELPSSIFISYII